MTSQLKYYRITDETVKDWNEFLGSLDMIRNSEREMVYDLNNHHRLQSDAFQDMKRYFRKAVKDVERLERKEK